MEKETKRFAVDRKEGGFFVLIPDLDGDDLLLSAADHPDLRENDVADVTFDGDRVISLVLLPEEKEKRLADMDRRLAALFARGKNTNGRK